MLSAISFNLDHSKILSFGKDEKKLHGVMVKNSSKAWIGALGAAI